MKTKIIAAIILVLVLVGVLGGIKGLEIKKLIDNGKNFAPPPEAVATVEAQNEDWQKALMAIGTVRAAQGVMISAEIPGMVQDIKFESGAHVAKDEVLVQLDTSAETAQLRAVEAQVELAKVNLDRVQKLRADNTVSVSELDTARANLEQLQANADAIRATIQKKIIRAPFAGILGLRQVDLGQYLEAGKTIVSLQALSPVFADFSLPQQDLARLKTGMKVQVTTDSYPGKKFLGTLSAINPNLDQATRSVPLRATFENDEELLRPGMFARVEVLLPDQESVLAIPSTAVLSAPFGDSVYVVESQSGNGKPQLTVRQQFIQTGRTRGDFIAVRSGLKPGERVVNSGLFKLRNGMAVVVNNDLVPETSTTPQPSDS